MNLTDEMSGAKSKRPGLAALMQAARKREIDAVVVWKLDRFGRSLIDLIQNIRELDSLGVRFVAVTQGIDTDQSNPSSRMLTNVLAVFAEFERDLIIERTHAGLARARAAGRIGGRPKRVFDRQKARDMRQQGMSLREIAAALRVPATTVARYTKSAAA